MTVVIGNCKSNQVYEITQFFYLEKNSEWIFFRSEFVKYFRYFKIFEQKVKTFNTRTLFAALLLNCNLVGGIG